MKSDVPAPTDEVVELLPCPFDGSAAAWAQGEQKEKYGNEQVYCPNCYASTAPEMTKEEAAVWWNARADSRPSAPAPTYAAWDEAIQIAKDYDHLSCAAWDVKYGRDVELVEALEVAKTRLAAPQQDQEKESE